MNSIHVEMLPLFLEGVDLSGSVVVVVDVLRASSTIIHAIGNGATDVIPCATVEEARQIAAEAARKQCDELPPGAHAQASARLGARRQSRGSGDILLGGERQGRLIAGFDLDNSPLNYHAGAVSGKRVVFTTTNGTRALASCERAAVVLIGAFVNESAVVRRLIALSKDVHLLCAGTEGQLTAEDILFAGAVVADLLDQSGESFAADGVQANMALDFYRARSLDPATFRRTIFESLGGKNLLQLGLKADLERCMERDLFDLVPVWDPATGTIQAG